MIKIMTEMSWPVRDDQTFLGTSPHITSSTARARGHQTKQRNIKYFQEIHHHSRYFSVKMSERICSTKTYLLSVCLQGLFDIQNETYLALYYSISLTYTMTRTFLIDQKV